jgi:putative holliday junction resolvase
VDLGRARVGIAVSDELRMLAHAKPPLEGRDKKALLRRLAALARDEDIERFLVGLPLELSGEQGPAARAAHGFATLLANATGCDVELVDERLTSVEAERRLAEAGFEHRKQRRAHVDGQAAAILLQSWLDRHAPDG